MKQLEGRAIAYHQAEGPRVERGVVRNGEGDPIREVHPADRERLHSDVFHLHEFGGVTASRVEMQFRDSQKVHRLRFGRGARDGEIGRRQLCPAEVVDPELDVVRPRQNRNLQAPGIIVDPLQRQSSLAIQEPDLAHVDPPLPLQHRLRSSHREALTVVGGDTEGNFARKLVQGMVSPAPDVIKLAGKIGPHHAPVVCHPGTHVAPIVGGADQIMHMPPIETPEARNIDHPPQIASPRQHGSGGARAEHKITVPG